MGVGFKDAHEEDEALMLQTPELNFYVKLLVAVGKRHQLQERVTVEIGLHKVSRGLDKL